MSKKTKYTHHNAKQQKTEAPEESAQTQTRWQAEQMQSYIRRARTCKDAAEGHVLWREAWDKRHSVPEAPIAINRILRERFISPRKTPANPHHGSLGAPVDYRNITIIVPMGPHDTPHSRRLNLKLYYVFRWFLYTRSLPRDLFCLKAKSPALPHGGGNACRHNGPNPRRRFRTRLRFRNWFAY